VRNNANHRWLRVTRSNRAVVVRRKAAPRFIRLKAEGGEHRLYRPLIEWSTLMSPDVGLTGWQFSHDRILYLGGLSSNGAATRRAEESVVT
jgi:hypothetical protein